MFDFFRTAWQKRMGIPENDVTQMGFPVYRRVFRKICEDKPNLGIQSPDNMQIWQTKPHL